MGRSPRLQAAGVYYHVTARGNARGPVFDDDADREGFVGFFARTLQHTAWVCLAWVLMGNHFHMVVHTPLANISRGMQLLCGGYARWYNRRHKRVGHLFQSRFHAEIIEWDGHLLEACRYVVLNPCRAGLCDDPAGWQWSSFAATAGLPGAIAPSLVDTDTVLGLFARDRDWARTRYQRFVREGMRELPGEGGRALC